MTDFPYVAPPVDGLRLAMAAARGRRYRKAGLSSATAASALMVVLAVLGGTGTQSLVQQPAPEQPAISQLVPGPAQEDTGTRNAVGAFTPVGHQGVAHLGTGAQGTVGDVMLHNGPAAPLPAGLGGSGNKPYAPGDIARNDNGVYVPDASCNVTGKAEDATTLCPAAYVYGPYAAPSPPYQLAGEICSTRTGTTTLHYSGRNEVDLAVYRGSTVVWRWSRWHPDQPAPHTIPVVTGGCSSWTLDWTAVDTSGTALPKGNYSLKVTFLAQELSGRSPSSTPFSIT